MIRLRLSFQGRVQGVGFRATAERAATRHALAGWVRNEPDGSVTMEIEGDPDTLERCIADLSATMARNIRTVSRFQLPIQGETGFDIHR
ncbi:MAG: acylphosphatase [Planctomycetota bacterium]|nr:acylphosphatase [Planctomycetota bacterium]